MIVLSKKGISERDWDSEAKEFYDEPIDSIASYLTHPVEIDEDFTLEDLFKLLEKERELVDIIFMANLGGHSFDLYLEDMKKEVPNNIDVDIKHLEVYWVAEHFVFEGVEDLNIYADFHGYGDWPKTDKEEAYKGGIAIEFSPLHSIKNYPIKLNREFKIYQHKTEPEKEPNRGKVILDTIREFNLYEVIGTILYEVSFMGDPGERDGALNDLLEMKQELDEAIEIDNNIKSEVFGGEPEDNDE